MRINAIFENLIDSFGAQILRKSFNLTSSESSHLTFYVLGFSAGLNRSGANTIVNEDAIFCKME
jgi:hypothetical protein